MTPEAKVKADIKKWLHRHFIFPASRMHDMLAAGIPFDGWYYMPVQGMYSVKGVPDFVICFKGRFVAVEAKAPGGGTTPNQDTQIEGILQAGGRVFVVDNASMLDEFLGEEVPA